MNESVKKKPRIEYFDFLRGISIILIIAVHTFDFSVFSSFKSFDLSVYFQQIFSVGTSLFLFVSGYFLYSKDLSTRDKYISFLKNRIVKIYVPMLLCAVWVLKGEIFTFKAFISIFIGGVSIYYFVVLIMQCYVLLPVFQKFTNLKFVFISLAMGVLSYLSYFYFFKDVPYWRQLVFFGVRFFAFIAGMYFRKNEDVFFDKSKDFNIIKVIFNKKLLFILAILFSVLAHLEAVSYFQNSTTSVGRSPVLVLFCFVFIFLIAQLKPFYKSNIIFRHIVSIGNVSFGIYLMHMIFVHILRDADIGFEQGINWFFRVMIVLYLTYFFIKIVQFIFPKKITALIGI